MAAVPTIDLTLADSDNEDIFHSFSSSTSVDKIDIRKENGKLRMAGLEVAQSNDDAARQAFHVFKTNIQIMKPSILFFQRARQSQTVPSTMKNLPTK